MEKENNSLFGVINYSEIEHLDKFISEMKRDHALYCLIQAVKYAYDNNIYSMEEGEAVSKAIRILTSPKEDEPPMVDSPEVFNA